MIILKTLKWSNCFSYGPNNELDLSATTLTQVLGSNGVGKSSIPIILEEVLYNKNSKGIKKADIANRNIGKSYTIYLQFEKDEDVYEIEVERAASIKVKLIHNGEDISSHTATNTYKTIQDIIGIDFKTFSQIVYQNTNASLQFLTATDTNRKKFLIDLLNLADYVNYFEWFKAIAKDGNELVSKLSGQLETVQKWLDTNKLTGATLLPLLNLPNQPEEEEKEYSSLMVEIKNISQKNKKISQNNQYKELLGAINISELQNYPHKDIKSYDATQTELGSVRAAIKSATLSLNKMKALEDECHTCGQQISNEFKEQMVQAEEEIIQKNKEVEEGLVSQIEEIQKHNAEVNKIRKQIEEWETLYQLVDNTLPSELLDEEKLTLRAKELASIIKEARASLEKVVEENRKITTNNTRIEVIKEQTSDFEEKRNKFYSELSEQEATLGNIEILKKAFSTNGLIAYKIENLVKDLEKLTNTYLAELSDGRFTLGFVVSNDKLNVEITDNGNIVDILALSSGELARVNTATLLAIRKLMSSISQSQINVLFLDEVINVLDEQGREKLVEVLLGEEDLNTYIVSHQWTHPLLEKIEVVKHGSISKLEV